MLPDNPHIQGAFFKALGYLDPNKKIVASISGGSDSDIVVDFISQCGFNDKVQYIFFDTGLEYQATKEHLDYLENRYGIQIERIRAYKSIPSCCNTYGQPFISKFVSENIERLQKHGFKFEDKPYSDLIEEYPGCKSSIQWWTNNHKLLQFCISYKKFLKEFLIDNPPDFKISSKCCLFAKKRTAKEFNKTFQPDIIITGVRKSEGGIRSLAYESCYTVGESGPDNYRPIWWFSDQDKNEYNSFYKIQNSKAYTKYGFKRTGCACCPFALNLENELKQTSKYEPKLYRAVNGVFGKSYQYTRQYYEYRANKENEILRDRIKTPPLESYLEGY